MANVFFYETNLDEVANSVCASTNDVWEEEDFRLYLKKISEERAKLHEVIEQKHNEFLTKHPNAFFLDDNPVISMQCQTDQSIERIVRNLGLLYSLNNGRYVSRAIEHAFNLLSLDERTGRLFCWNLDNILKSGRIDDVFDKTKGILHSNGKGKKNKAFYYVSTIINSLKDEDYEGVDLLLSMQANYCCLPYQKLVDLRHLWTVLESREMFNGSHTAFRSFHSLASRSKRFGRYVSETYRNHLWECASFSGTKMFLNNLSRVTSKRPSWGAVLYDSIPIIGLEATVSLAAKHSQFSRDTFRSSISDFPIEIITKWVPDYQD